MTRWPLADAAIVGFTRPWAGTALFAPADLVLRAVANPAQLLQVVSYPADDDVEGLAMDEAEWAALVSSGDAATLLAPEAARAHATGWLLRAAAAKAAWGQKQRVREQLWYARARLGPTIVGPHKARLYLVDDRRAAEIREALAEDAYRRAHAAALGSAWDVALCEADLAFVLTTGLRVDRVALPALLHARTGNTTRAAGLVAMAANSRGAAWAAEVVAAQKTLAAELGLEVP